MTPKWYLGLARKEQARIPQEILGDRSILCAAPGVYGVQPTQFPSGGLTFDGGQLGTHLLSDSAYSWVGTRGVQTHAYADIDGAIVVHARWAMLYVELTFAARTLFIQLGEMRAGPLGGSRPLSPTVAEFAELLGELSASAERRPSASDHSVATEIERLAALHSSGSITDEEFAAAKGKLLS